MLASVIMDESRGKVTIGPKKWLAIRTAFIVEGLSINQCAEQFHVDRTTIAKRASKEKWNDQRHQMTTNGQEVVTKRMQQAVEDGIALHVSAADELLDVFSELRTAFIAAVRSGDEKEARRLRSLIEAGKSLSEMGDKTLRLGRVVRGIRDGEASDAASSEDSKWVIEHQELEPRKIAVNEQGRAVSGE